MRIYRYGSTIAVMLSNKVKYNNVVLAAYVVFVNVITCTSRMLKKTIENFLPEISSRHSAPQFLEE